MLPTGETGMAHVADGPLGDRTFDDAYVRPPVARRSCSQAAAGGSRSASTTATRTPRSSRPPADDVIAFEPMTAPTNALASGVDLPIVAAGERFDAAFTITVTDF